MGWRKIFVRKSGRKPRNGRVCKKCDHDVTGEVAWHNRNSHRSKYYCVKCGVPRVIV